MFSRSEVTGPRRRRWGFVVVTAVLSLFLFAAAAPTPLYAYYASTWHFSLVNITVIFGVYAVALLLTLLVGGSLSDAVGRRPVVLTGLLLQAVAMVLFVRADALGWLYAARIVQGVATGLVTAAVAAALIDLQPRAGFGALVNAVIPTFGLAAGAFGTGALVQYGPAPTQLVFAAVLVACLVLAAAVLAVLEPMRPRGRVSVSVRFGVDRAVRPAFLAATPCLVATWALGGFSLSLGPSLTLQLLHSTNRLAGATAVTALTVAGGLASLAIRDWAPRRAMIGGCIALALGAGVITLGIAASSVGVFLAGNAVAGLGFGAAFLGAFRTLAGLASPERRGGLVSAVYVVAYLAFSVPAVVAGVLSTVVGLPVTAIGFGIAVAALALLAIVATARTLRSVPLDPATPAHA